jgi:hypothetical protein
MSSEDTANTIKRRLRSAGENLAQHTLETAKDAAKGLENTHAAYIYPIQVSLAQDFVDILGDLLFSHSSWITQTFLRCRCDLSCLGGWDRCCDLFLWLSSSSTYLRVVKIDDRLLQ